MSTHSLSSEGFWLACSRNAHENVIGSLPHCFSRCKCRKKATKNSNLTCHHINPLDVEPQQVIPDQTEYADRQLSVETAIRSVPVVSVNPPWEIGGTLFDVL